MARCARMGRLLRFGGDKTGAANGRQPMSELPSVTTVNRMIKAVFDRDRVTLARIVTNDLAFHLRGPFTKA